MQGQQKTAETNESFEDTSKTDKSYHRSATIAKIKSSLKILPIISRNQTMVARALHSLGKDRQPATAETSSNDSFSIQEEGAVRPTLRRVALFQENYNRLEKIGQGSNGVVHRCVSKTTGKEYAVKSQMIDDEQILQLKINFLAVKGIQHPCVVRYRALYLDLRKHLCHLIMEYVPYPKLSKTPVKCEEELKWIVYLLLDTLHSLHERHISHRDLKDDNVLYCSQTRQLKIIDFGICKKNRRRSKKLDMMTITGTLFYRAPEMFSGGSYTEKVDVWALAILIYKRVTARTPFESEYLSDTIHNIQYSEPYFAPQIWSAYSLSLKNLLQRLLKKSANERLSAAECLRDSWFYSITRNSTLHRGSLHIASAGCIEEEEEEEKKRALRSPIQGVTFLDLEQYDRTTCGDQYHCIDDDEDAPRKKRPSKTNELDDFSLQ